MLVEINDRLVDFIRDHLMEADFNDTQERTEEELLSAAINHCIASDLSLLREPKDEEWEDPGYIYTLNFDEDFEECDSDMEVIDRDPYREEDDTFDDDDFEEPSVDPDEFGRGDEEESSDRYLE